MAPVLLISHMWYLPLYPLARRQANVRACCSSFSALASFLRWSARYVSSTTSMVVPRRKCLVPRGLRCAGTWAMRMSAWVVCASLGMIHRGMRLSLPPQGLETARFADVREHVEGSVCSFAQVFDEDAGCVVVPRREQGPHVGVPASPQHVGRVMVKPQALKRVQKCLQQLVRRSARVAQP